MIPQTTGKISAAWDLNRIDEECWRQTLLTVLCWSYLQMGVCVKVEQKLAHRIFSFIKHLTADRLGEDYLTSSTNTCIKSLENSLDLHKLNKKKNKQQIQTVGYLEINCSGFSPLLYITGSMTVCAIFSGRAVIHARWFQAFCILHTRGP